MTSVTLLACCADDLAVVNAARVSQGKRGERFDPDADPRLIAYLMRERHGSPFEHTYFRFHVVAPVFAQRDWMRHRAGHSYNEVSTRWQEMGGLGVYEPERLREQLGRPHEYRYADFDPGAAGPLARLRHRLRRRALVSSQRRAVARYRRMVRRGYAREQAMAALPMGVYTEFWWSCNARSLMHFLALRSAQTARRELREACAQIEAAFASAMPATHAAFVDCGRAAP